MEKTGKSASESAARSGRWPRGGQLFGPLIGLLFLAYPVKILLSSDPSAARLVFAAAGTALFVGVFLWLIWLHEPVRAKPEASEVFKRRAAVTVLAVLASMLAVVDGYPWLTLFVHTSIGVGIMLPQRDAYVVIASLAVVVSALARVLGEGWIFAGRFVLPLVALGLLMVAFTRQIVAVAELRIAREEIARLAVAEERLRFARDLHDLLGHSLSLITLKSELAGRLLPAAPQRAATEVRDIEGVARKALREVREAVAGYRQPMLDEELDGAREMLEAAGIDCRIENEAGGVTHATDAVLAWAVREGATNVIRHSRAQGCGIRLTRDGEEIFVEISDDGWGSPPERDGAPFDGSGLSGLAERVAKSGGHFEAGPLPEGGFRLRVSLPLRAGTNSAAEPEAGGSSASEVGRR